jgi:hypothetical protein
MTVIGAPRRKRPCGVSEVQVADLQPWVACAPGTVIRAVLIAAASAGQGQDHDRGRCRMS